MQNIADTNSILPISMTIDQATNYTGIGRASIYRAINDGKLTPKKYGKRTLLMTEDLERFINTLPDGLSDGFRPE